MQSLAIQFGQILRELRQAQGLTQEQIALECNLDRTFISLLERGLRQPTLSTLFSIAGCLKTSPTMIIKRLEKAHENR